MQFYYFLFKKKNVHVISLNYFHSFLETYILFEDFPFLQVLAKVICKFKKYYKHKQQSKKIKNWYIMKRNNTKSTTKQTQDPKKNLKNGENVQKNSPMLSELVLEF
jgi:hypothetical protein